MDLLQRAAQEAEAEHWPDAEALLVAAWRHRPAARIARTLAAIEPRLPAVAGIRGKTVTAREDRWFELAGAKDDGDLRALLATPWPTFPREASRRIDALGEWPAHPHISNALLALHARRQYASNAGRRLSRQIFRVLLAHRDPAIGLYRAQLASATDAVSIRERDDLAGMMRRKLPPEPELDADDAAALARIDALVAPIDTAATREQLFAAVYAAPHDDGPRAVLADFLIERGELRGELIALQLARADSKREKLLVRESGNQWFDGLDEDGASDIVLERGLPTRARCGAIELAAPGWVAIEELALDDAPRDLRPLRSLRRLFGAPTAKLGAIAGLAGLPLDALSLTDVIGLGATAVPRPAQLGIYALRDEGDHRAVADGIHALPIGERLVALQLNLEATSLPFAVELLANHAWLERVVIHGGRDDRYLRQPRTWSAIVRRDHLALAWGANHGFGTRFEELPALLRALHRPAFTRIEIARGVYSGNHARIYELARAAIENWPKLETAVLE